MKRNIAILTFGVSGSTWSGTICGRVRMFTHGKKEPVTDAEALELHERVREGEKLFDVTGPAIAVADVAEEKQTEQPPKDLAPLTPVEKALAAAVIAANGDEDSFTDGKTCMDVRKMVTVAETQSGVPYTDRVDRFAPMFAYLQTWAVSVSPESSEE